MWQMITSGYQDLLNSSTTEYASPWGQLNNTWTTSEATRRQMVPGTGRVHSFGVELNAATGGGGGTFTLRKNQADTSLAVVFSGTTIRGIDPGDPVEFSAGDNMTIKWVPNSPNLARTSRWFFVWEDDDENQYIMVAGSSDTLPGTAQEENNWTAGENWNTLISSFTPDVSRQICVIDGTLRDFYIESSADPNPGQYQFRVREAGTNTALTATITSGNTTAADTSNTETITANNSLDVTVAPSSSPTSAYCWWGTVFEPSGDIYVSPYGGNSRNALNLANNTIEYNYIWCGAESWTTNQNVRKSTTGACFVSNFRVEMNQNLPSGVSVQFWIRRNNTDTALSVTLSPSTSSSSNDTDVVEFADFDEIQVKYEVSNTGSTPIGTWAARWGVTVGVIKPFPNSQMMMGMGI